MNTFFTPKNIFFTADTHFNHKNVIKYCNRPFADVTEMNESLIQRWNSVVHGDDLVYHLGDFGFGNWKAMADIRRRLHGRIFMALGNHDMGFTQTRWLEGVKIDGVFDYIEFEEFHLSHLPAEEPEELRNVDRSRESRKYFEKYSSACLQKWRLCGHVHDAWIYHFNKTNHLNMGVDVWNYTPVHIDRIRAYILDSMACK